MTQPTACKYWIVMSDDQATFQLLEIFIVDFDLNPMFLCPSRYRREHVLYTYTVREDCNNRKAHIPL